MIKKSPNPIDTHVGGRVRMRRMMLKMSQEKLGGSPWPDVPTSAEIRERHQSGWREPAPSTSVTFCRSRCSFFFEGLPHRTGCAPVKWTRRREPDLRGPTSSPPADGLALIKAFTRIKDAKLRRRIVDLVEQITAENDH